MLRLGQPLRPWWIAWLLSIPWIGIAAAYFALGHNSTSRILGSISLLVALGWVGRGMWDRARSN
jgi:hypothetical protein